MLYFYLILITILIQNTNEMLITEYCNWYKKLITNYPKKLKKYIITNDIHNQLRDDYI